MNIPSSARPRVLLADDHIRFRDSVSRLLAPTCDIVGTAADGHQALEMATRLLPDVVVLDIAMPNCNGFQALEQLRRDGPDTRVVFLTMHSDDEFVAAAINGGAYGFVLKSRLHLDLISAIDHALAGRRFLPSMTALATVGGSQHAVQFHANGSHVLDDVSQLAGVTLQSGGQVVLVASDTIRDGVAQRLQARHLNLAVLAEREQYVATDSAIFLEQVMRDGRPDKARVAELIQGLEELRLAAPSVPPGRLTIVGDPSGILCRNGKFEAALELERLWNELTHALPFFTVCLYSIDCFDHSASTHLPNVCAQHGAVSHTGTSRRVRDIN